MGKPRDAMPRWLWGPLPGMGVRSGLEPRTLIAEEKPSRSSGLVGVGRPGEEGPWSPGVPGA